MTVSRAAKDLAGRTIKEVFHRADEISDLHSSLTSPRGDFFRLRLLQGMEVPADEAFIEQWRVESGVQEHQRHLHKLLRLGLIWQIEVEGQSKYRRTDLGERAVNAVRELERSIGQEDASSIYGAALGPNSIRFFLRIYGKKIDPGQEPIDIKYTPAEIGRLSLFLPRVIDGVSAADKLGEAGLLVYRDDGYIHMQPVKARGFYRYLRELHGIIRANGNQTEGRWRRE